MLMASLPLAPLEDSGKLQQREQRPPRDLQSQTLTQKSCLHHVLRTDGLFCQRTLSLDTLPFACHLTLNTRRLLQLGIVTAESVYLFRFRSSCGN